MSRIFYPKLAITNIKKNGKTYFPYIITCICTIAMYYMMHALSLNKGLYEMKGGDSLKTILSLGVIVIAIFSGIFLFYTNSFLIKRRKKELGLYNVLGLGKSHIARVLFYECLFTSMLSLTAGLACGIILNKVMFLLLLKILSFDVPLGFTLSAPSITSTLILFCIIFGSTLITNLLQIKLSNPIELLKGGQVGEKEPKTKLVMTFIGLLCLLSGYGIALSAPDPLTAIVRFFIAVLLVMAGTYALFTAGSIALLKLLKKNKNFYYKTKHFISISSMMYRMKRNAVGLANICILSTAVIITLSGTISLFAGMEDIMKTRFARDINISKAEVSVGDIKKIDETLNEFLDNYKTSNYFSYRRYDFLSDVEDNQFSVESFENFDPAFSYVEAVPIEDYNRAEGKNIQLEDDEVILFFVSGTYGKDSIVIDGTTYKVKEINELEFSNKSDGLWLDSYYIFMNEPHQFTQSTNPFYQVSFDIEATDDEIIQINNDIKVDLSATDIEARVESRAGNKESFLAIYGGLFFLGIFLGSLFLMATVLIIYYKQISEGYDDKERFEIMQKVGIDQVEVKKTIRTQVLMVFFLPLLFATLHIVVAFPIITKLLAILNLFNVPLFLMMTVATVLVFAMIYGFVFLLTAKTYYKIVDAK
ncbi:FtsX-like permease family protein [Vallitalea okinawensis]|uniref:FtsX-like permease family protein n=1 Tax=Vallitalea okinawensis TaxID=2078660 RepID=UPI000CFD8E05|nr:ABC transporter permease [Vallitalea okinawensis]